jgi:hypothetical protein
MKQEERDFLMKFIEGILQDQILSVSATEPLRTLMRGVNRYVSSLPKNPPHT